MKYLPVLWLLACRTDKQDVVLEDETIIEENDIDNDGDGFSVSDGDCDDENALVYPNAEEVCDDIDNNCDGDIDEELLTDYYQDDDADGFGDPEDIIQGCSQPEGTATLGTDCDDNNPLVHPDMEEICDDLDNNCDGDTDEDLQTDWWIDEDGDGFGDPNYFAEGCLEGQGFAANAQDCDDNNPLINPDIEEVCDEVDNNCDGNIDEDLRLTVYVDADEDGFGDNDQPVSICEIEEGFTLVGGDCDDIDSATFPGALEVCDDIDNDCDGVVDDGVGSPGTVWYFDGDGDGYGDSNISEIGCVAGADYILQGGDCDDADPFNYPNNTEVCDGQDNNCDTLIDDNDPFIVGQTTFYQDLDLDGVGGSLAQNACVQPSGFVTGTGDCDDLNNTVYPAAPEICDGIDNTCDGLVDDNDPNVVGQTTFYQDSDGDGNGSNISQTVCFQPTSYVPTTGDCDDSNTAIYATAPEICDTLDNNCNGLVDDDDPSVVGQIEYFTDGDLDGFGDPSQGVFACFQPSGTVTNGSDCDDSNGSISPIAQEVCDGIDNNCDDNTDDNDSTVNGQLTWYLDADGDGFGGGLATVACNPPTQNMVQQSGDCVDNQAAINPNATEVCDLVDNDCDGQIDDNDSSLNTSSGTTFYLDSDGDGFGANGSSVMACLAPSSNHITSSGDCNDQNNQINPNMTETCNNTDDNCNGTVDENASNATTWYLDGDNDGFGSPHDTTASCSQPSGYVSNDDDCDDLDGGLQYCETCKDVLELGVSSTSGVFALDPCGSGSPSNYYCDLSTDNGGWTVGGWQSSSGSLLLGTQNSGTLGGSSWSRDLSCVVFEEIMVFNQTNGQFFKQNYGASEWMVNFQQSGSNVAYGSPGTAFKLGYYGNSTAMGCVKYRYGNQMYVQFACDSDGQASAQGHLANYAGEYCSGGRLDGTWAWSNGSTCSLRGANYTWGIAIR